MAPKSSSTKAKHATLKQGTLQFATSKRTVSSNSITKAKQPSLPKKSVTSGSGRSSTGSSQDASLDEVELISEEEEGNAHKEEDAPVRATLRPRVSSGKKQPSGPPISVLQPKDSQENSQVGKAARPELSDKDHKWDQHHRVVRQKMGNQRASESSTSLDIGSRLA